MDIQTVIDKQAIKDLQVFYSMTIDSGKYDLLDDVFLPDVIAEYGPAGNHQGVEGIKGACAIALDVLTGVQHLNGNHWAEIDGDTATAGYYFSVHMQKENTPGGDHYLMGGRYDDELVRTPAGWRIAKRSLEVVWSEGNRAVRFDR